MGHYSGKFDIAKIEKEARIEIYKIDKEAETRIEIAKIDEEARIEVARIQATSYELSLLHRKSGTAVFVRA